MLAALLCSTTNTRAQQFAWGNGKVIYRGNTFECDRPHLDTLFVDDPVTNEHLVKYGHTTPDPQTMNGQKIYKLAELVETNTAHNDGGPVEEFVINGLKPTLALLPDGWYGLQIETIVADETGRIVYYFFPGVNNYCIDCPTPSDVQAAIVHKVDELINAAPTVNPGLIDGKPVVFLTELFDHTYHIELTNRKLFVKKAE